MDTLKDRLAGLAEKAPTGGSPATDLWARGKQVQRRRAAALVLAVAVGAAGTGIGVRLAEGGADRSGPQPAGTIDAPHGLALPIHYPAGDLGDLTTSPGQLAAIWVSPESDGSEVVGLVAATGRFGRLPIDPVVTDDPDPSAPGAALSPDGRWVAFSSSPGEITVHDLRTGRSSTPLGGIETSNTFTWLGTSDFPDFELIGHVAGGRDADGWRWQPGRPAKLVDLRTHLRGRGVVQPYGTRDVWLGVQGGGPETCTPPVVDNWLEQWDLVGMCDVLHVVDPTSASLGQPYVLGHREDPRDDNKTVVAVPFTSGFDGSPPSDPVLVVDAGAPERVSLATELVAAALEEPGP